MDDTEARALVERALPRFGAAGLPALDADSVQDVRARSIASLWAGMGTVYTLAITPASGAPVTLCAKRVSLPDECDSIGDQRKKDSYDVEAAFYSRGHAERLIAAGARVPFPLHVEARAGGVTIVMTQLEGSSSAHGEAEAFVTWLATLHATYWGERSDVACGAEGGLQAQGCYWHLDTRPDEHRRIRDPRMKLVRGARGRRRRRRAESTAMFNAPSRARPMAARAPPPRVRSQAARAIDLRLKADACQGVCHGDAKGANILYARDDSGACVPLVYDFQYCGKACVTKDLAYFFNVEAGHGDEARLLQLYHRELCTRLDEHGDAPPSLEALETSLELAIADWRRFSEVGLGGWGDGAADRRVQELLKRLDGGKVLDSEEAYIEAVQREFPV